LRAPGRGQFVRVPSAFLFTALVFGAAVLVALLIGGWGPAPVFAIVFLVLVAPGAIAGWLLYRRRVRTGEVPPLGAEARHQDDSVPSPTRREAEAAEPERQTVP
jgi:hypothetical protein